MPDPHPYLVLGPIIGGLSHRRVRLWGRTNGPAIMRAWLASMDDLRDSAVYGETELREQTGYTGVIDISALEPNCRYHYALSINSGGRPPAREFRSFQTFPRPGEMHDLRFAFGSCFRPGNQNPGRAFKHMLENQSRLDFLILEGNQIYADEWQYNGLGHVAMSLEDYRRVYLHTWSNPWHRALLRQTPVFMMLDDHEVDNDWRWHNREHTHGDIPIYTRAQRWAGRLDSPQCTLALDRIGAALQAYDEHQGMHAPVLTMPQPARRGGVRLVECPAGVSLAYTFYFGSAAFFVMDTRTQRVRHREQLLLGEAQWQRLEEWLLAVKDEFPVKFIVSSSTLLFEMLGDFANDRWGSFRAERDRLFYFLAAHGISGVYILAGDLHEGHAVSSELHGPEGRTIPLWEFSATPFEQTPNWMAAFLKMKPHSAALQHSRIHYSIHKINYGVVDVRFYEPACPRVNFELYYEDKGQWKMKLTETSVDQARS
jgi:alkaline phosphatase D